MAYQQKMQLGISEVKLFSAAKGLVDSFDPMRESEDSLFVAENVVVDLTGAVERRNGRTLVRSGACHSLFSCGKWGLGVFAGVLSLINEDYSITALKAIGNFPVAYVRTFDGSDERVYLSNGFVSGFVKNGGWNDWVTAAYVGIDSTSSRVNEYLTAPPTGSLLEVFCGRMYVGSGKLLWYSEPFDYSRFRLNPIVFDSTLTMLLGVQGGLYVGTQEEIFFLGGTNPLEFSFNTSYSHGAITGTSARVLSSDIEGQEKYDVIVFSSPDEGICVGDSAGTVINLTQVIVDFPESGNGACCVTSDKQYIVAIGG